MRKLSLIILTFALTTVSFASGRVSVRSFNIEGLNRYAGKSVSVFYVSGRSPGFSLPGARPRVRKVLKKSGPFNVSSAGKVTVSGVNLMETGWERFNFLGVVVHEKSQAHVAIKNLDGSTPDGQTDSTKPGAFNNLKVYFAPKAKINSGTLRLR